MKPGVSKSFMFSLNVFFSIFSLNCPDIISEFTIWPKKKKKAGKIGDLTCPIMRGTTTVIKSWEKIDVKGTEEEEPSCKARI